MGSCPRWALRQADRRDSNDQDDEHLEHWVRHQSMARHTHRVARAKEVEGVVLRPRCFLPKPIRRVGCTTHVRLIVPYRQVRGGGGQGKLWLYEYLSSSFSIRRRALLSGTCMRRASVPYAARGAAQHVLQILGGGKTLCHVAFVERRPSSAVAEADINGRHTFRVHRGRQGHALSSQAGRGVNWLLANHRRS